MILKLLTFVCWFSIIHVYCQPLTSPISVSSENGKLQTVLTIEKATHTLSNSDITITTRMLNGTFPGPTFRLKPGDTFNVHFSNKLTDQAIPYRHNEISAPDETNIHFHGLHVSGELPSDDATYVVLPGESYSYTTKLPENHMPGTHWLHPHRHGSTSLQVGGGAAAAIIVEDPPGTLPPQVENATEIVFLAQQIDLDELRKVAAHSGDNLVSISTTNSNRYVSINGQINPTISITPGEWVRFRVIWAAWLQGLLDFSIPECEMQLLAKDGIYIRDFPRSIQSAPIVPAGRADIMVRCSGVSTTYNINGEGNVIATIQTTAGPVIASTTLQPWTPKYPAYLSDLRDVAATPECSCITNFGETEVNEQTFDPTQRMHQSYLGAVVEREIEANNHPYHQHVYPYQLVSGFGGYNVIGDWHDTIEGNGLIRYQPEVFAGKLMVHCHRLKHEDRGMMAIEEILPSNQPICTCGNPAFPVWAMALIGAGTAVIIGCILYVAHRSCRRNKPKQGTHE